MTKQAAADKNLDDLKEMQRLAERVTRRAKLMESDSCECAARGDEGAAELNAFYAAAHADAIAIQVALQKYKASATVACNADTDVTANFGGT